MKNLEKRAVYFFDRLAMLISEDPEVLWVSDRHDAGRIY